MRKPKDRKAIEEELFTYDGTAWVTDSITYFYDATLVKAIGLHQPGETFPGIQIDMERSTLTLYHSEYGGHQDKETYSISLQVGDRLD